MSKFIGDFNFSKTPLINADIKGDNPNWRTMLIALVTRHGASPKLLAEQLQVSSRTINRLLKGESANPKVATRLKIIALYRESSIYAK